MMNLRLSMRFSALFLIAALCCVVIPAAHAAELQAVDESRLAGIAFDDKPLALPVQRNFQMAMLTVSSELGRSCGSIEAYGWRMKADEQTRVNGIFNNTVDHLRGQGFVVQAQKTNVVADDVTLFTADRSDKHLIFMWSAGDVGLVLVLCETSAPLTQRLVATGKDQAPSVSAPASAPTMGTLRAPAPRQSLAQRQQENSPVPLTSSLPTPTNYTRTGMKAFPNFSPVGDWVGSYSCLQGATGVTLTVSSLHNDRFEGVFKFYPTPRSPDVASGSYKVYGDYDPASRRILINPGKWIHHPANYYNTVMMGSFDPVAKTFRGYFEGISGCTSIEARYESSSAHLKGVPSSSDLKKAVKAKKHAKAKAKKKAAKPQPVVQENLDDKPAVTSTTPEAETPGASIKLDAKP